MYPRAFHYVCAESVDHAVALLAEHGEEARPLAGGASLIPLLKLRLASPSLLIDIGRLAPLAGMAWRADAVTIGALTPHADVEDDARLRAALPAFHEVAAHIGDAQIRNVGTIGGSLAEADPAGDWAPALLALRGTVQAVGPSGPRRIAADDFFIDAYTTALAPNELLAGVNVGLPAPRSGSAHEKFEVRAGDFAVANCTVALTLDAEGRCARVGIGLGGVGLVPVRPHAAEALLLHARPTPALLAEAREAVRQATEGFEDVRGSAAYREQLGGTMFERAFDRAWRRARGEEDGRD